MADPSVATAQHRPGSTLKIGRLSRLHSAKEEEVCKSLVTTSGLLCSVLSACHILFLSFS